MLDASEIKFCGLTSQEVFERTKAGQYNKPIKAPSKSIPKIIFDNTFTYFNGVFAFLTAVLVAVHSYRDLTFLGVVIANTLIGIVQEIRTKNVLDGLTMLNAQKARTIRDGKLKTVLVNELVLDDVVLFKAGDQIPADAKVIDGSVSVNEALLTGEADEIQKKVDDELLSGSFIVSGKCYAKLTKVGKDSYISKLTLQAKAIKNGEQSEIIRSLNRIVTLAGIAIIPIGSLMYGHQFYVRHLPLSAAVQNGASAVLGMIPEGLFLLASVSLAISAMRLAKNRVLVHEMKCIETLARVDVLCVDKTGTITSPNMKVREWKPLGKKEDVEEKIRNLVGVLESDNATIKALKKKFHSDKEIKPAITVFGFSSRYKYSAAEFKTGNLVIGAPEFVLKNKYEKYESDIRDYAEKGYRVLMFGEYKKKLDGQELSESIKPLAMIVLENPVRKTAPETFRYFREQGVNVKVISGDNPLTVAEVAKQAGIEGAEKVVDMSAITTEEQIEEAAEKYTVFGRVTPEQKRKLVKALQAKGHRVAMTGDGVNDVLALKDADCSIAMASGSDAAVQAAQLVLLDSNFAKMPQVVREGRRVVNNLERSGSLFLVKNIFSLLAAALTLVFGLTYPMLPAQVSMLSIWTIGLPSFFLAQLPNENLIKGHFIANILSKAIPGAIASTVVVFLMMIGCNLLGVPEEQISTACTLIFALAGMIYLYMICQPLDNYRAVVYFGSLIGLGICFIFLRSLFRLSSEISVTCLLLGAGLGLIVWPMLIFLPKLLKNPLAELARRVEG